MYTAWMAKKINKGRVNMYLPSSKEGLVLFTDVPIGSDLRPVRCKNVAYGVWMIIDGRKHSNLVTYAACNLLARLDASWLNDV